MAGQELEKPAVKNCPIGSSCDPLNLGYICGFNQFRMPYLFQDETGKFYSFAGAKTGDVITTVSAGFDQGSDCLRETPVLVRYLI